MWSTREAAQRRVACLVDVLGVAADAQPLPVVAAHIAELGGEHDLVAAPPDRTPHEDLVGERAVHVGRVEEVDPQLERPLDRRDRLLVVALAVELGHPHAPEPLLRDLEPLATKIARLHHVSPIRTSIFPRFSPRSSPIKASGACSMPSTTVSR